MFLLLEYESESKKVEPTRHSTIHAKRLATSVTTSREMTLANAIKSTREC